jgi:hypothetical protein
MARRLSLLLLPAAALAACTPPAAQRPRAVTGSVAVEETEPWRETATAASISAIDALPVRWAAARAAASARNSRAIAGEAALLAAEGALPRPDPAPGPYRCRTVRVAPGAARARVVIASRWDFCFVGADQQGTLSLTVDLPADRVGGYLYQGKDALTLVFLGGGVPRGARRPLAYGESEASDVVGIFQRIDDFRYRLVVAPGADLLVYELIAAPRDAGR